jgi:hypothetical protein
VVAALDQPQVTQMVVMVAILFSQVLHQQVVAVAVQVIPEAAQLVQQAVQAVERQMVPAQPITQEEQHHHLDKAMQAVQLLQLETHHVAQAVAVPVLSVKIKQAATMAAMAVMGFHRLFQAHQHFMQAVAVVVLKVARLARVAQAVAVPDQMV